MRVYISADLEGVNGVVHSSQTQPGEPGYERAIGLMHEELTAVIAGVRDAGAKEIAIADAHWDARNLRAERLPAGVHLISGWQRPFSMMSGVSGKILDKAVAAGDFDCAYFVGYHARAGVARGILSHTYRAQIYSDVQLDGRSVGEFGLNAALAGHFGVPAAFLSGDDAACAEAADLVDSLVCIPVKQAVSRYSGICGPHAESLARLQEGARQAMDPKHWKVFKSKNPAALEITFFDPAMADAAELLPQVERTGDRTIRVVQDDFSVLFRLFLAIGVLGANRKDPYF